MNTFETLDPETLTRALNDLSLDESEHKPFMIYMHEFCNHNPEHTTLLVRDFKDKYIGLYDSFEAYATQVAEEMLQDIAYSAGRTHGKGTLEWLKRFFDWDGFTQELVQERLVFHEEGEDSHKVFVFYP